MNKEEFLSLLTEKFSGMDAAHLESLAASLAAQQPDAHQGQALVNKLTTEQVADYLAATTPTPTGITPSVAGDTQVLRTPWTSASRRVYERLCWLSNSA